MFKGKVGIITGAGKGLGRAYALYIGRRGGRVVVNNRARNGEDSAQTVVDKIIAAGGQAIVNHDPVEAEGAGERMVAAALDHYGQLDFVINNAGVSEATMFHKQSLAAFKNIMDINLMGSIALSHAAYKVMREAGAGRIILSMSSAGLFGNHGGAAYSASKAGLYGFMRALHVEAASRGVYTNAISPYGATPMTAAYLPPDLCDRMSPDLVAPLVAWLASDHCMVSGEVFVSGCGRLRHARMETSLVRDFPSDDPSPTEMTELIRAVMASDCTARFENAQEDFANFIRS
ncbi:SDR family NAD(P)-dependent oxidoreductase [Govanella unica]|uniref:SDR family NAD(P)-dependent oxidoreductase n=1 Tax=Govanella unica TaxID=2975056 RepID=A0A9X3TYF6_9PROT|nr:SDR family NAD(P)-dependent oxidoreductase [Govania unica]MDA5193839.1 SDR family NAD(P)-dependent oxidoreductase [Govania unica]